MSNLFFILLACVLTVPLSSIAQAASPNRVVITPSGITEREAVLFVAHDQGFFRKYDIQAEIVDVRSGSIAIAALAAGESQFYYGSA